MTPPLPVLVTGGGGMIGSSLVRLLHRRGHSVRVHLGPPGSVEAAPPEGLETGRAEITDASAVGALCTGVGAVVHLAGPASVAASFADPAGSVRAHVEGTAVVLEACRRAGVRRLVYVSSAEVYGQVRGGRPVPESQPARPVSPYGAAKVGAEALVRGVAWPLEVVVLRPFSVYAPTSPVTSVVGTVLRAVTSPGEVELRSLTPVRDYVHVDDVAGAITAALTVPSAGAPVYNVGTGVGTSVLDLARTALAAAGRSAVVREAHPLDRPADADLTHLVADTTLARDGLEWCAQVTLEEGLRDSGTR